jgi:hypothetical protein
MKRFTTKVKTRDGKIFDLGEFKFPPKHDHKGGGSCEGCLVANAYTEEI